MRNRFYVASASILTLALTACGGPAEEADDVPAETEIVTDDSAALPDAAVDGDAVDAANGVEGDAEAAAAAQEPAAATPAPGASATSTPRPTPTSTPTPKPTQVARVAQPAAFTTCMVCHATTPGQNGVGPSLAGVVGRKAGSASGFSYSAGMQAANLSWTEANLRRYLVDPIAVVPGSTMPPPGVDAAQASAIVAYLKTL